jgi:FkbM family methyltransferase
MALPPALARTRRYVADVLRPLNKPRVYRARHGLAVGLKQIGGIGLVLPKRLRKTPEYPEFAGLEDTFLRHLDFEGKTVYDIGAFKGILTMFFARQVGERGSVVAFEPHPESFALIRQHVRLNGMTNTDVLNIGIGRRLERRVMVCPDGCGHGRATADDRIYRQFEAAGPVERSVITVNSLDDEIVSSGLPEPDFIKIDVEGMEIEALEGMSETLARSRPDLYVEIHGADLEAKRFNADGAVRLLSERGYALHHVESDQMIQPSNAEMATRGHIYASEHT